ncbi:MAG: phosphotransferase [Aeromonadaceae bacterium]
MVKGLPAPYQAGVLIPLSEGLTNQAYCLTLPDDICFLRVGSPYSLRLGIDRHKELQLLRLAVERGFSPAIRFADAEQGVLLCDWVAGGPHSLTQWQSPSGLARLGNLVAAIHGMKVPPFNLDLVAHLRFYLARICHRDPRLTRLFSKAEQQLRALPPVRQVFCHNDLHPGNLLGERPWVVDWEYAAVGDPGFELAGIVRNFSLDKAHTTTLLQHYQAAGGECSEARVEAMLPIVDLTVALWANVHWEASNQPEYRTLFLEQLNRLSRYDGGQS